MTNRRTSHRQPSLRLSVSLGCLGWALVMGLAARCEAGQNPLVLAFSAEDIDVASCREYVDGKAGPADADRVRRALGRFPKTGDWQKDLWEVGGGPDGKETVYHFLVVFKRPLEIGTICLGQAEGFRSTKGSVTGGELFCLDADAQTVPEPGDKQWVKIALASPPQHLRFATLPVGTRVRAFLYKDVRVSGKAQLFYLSALRARLQDLTPAAAGAGSPAEDGLDPANVPAGRRWEVNVTPEVSERKPASFTLVWEKKQRLDGVFLFCNAQKFRLLSHDGEASDPLAAPRSRWKEIEFKDQWAYPKALPSWKWLSFPAVEIRAVRIEVSGVIWSPKCFWIQGFAALTALGDRAPLALTPQDTGLPFRVPVEFPESGDGALVVDDAKGRRVRNVFAQTYCAKGPSEFRWDLKNDDGTYVEPGQYTWKAIVGPQLELRYGITPCPNVQNFFPERMPWMAGDSGPHGWLADHGANAGCATSGDRVYFGAQVCEAGVILIECDLQGRRLWALKNLGGWDGVYRMTADDDSVYAATHTEVHRIDRARRLDANRFPLNAGPHTRGSFSGMAAREGKVYLAYTGEQVIDNSATARDLDIEQCIPAAPLDAPWGCSLVRLLRIEGTPPGFSGLGSEQKQPPIVSPASDKPQGNGRLFLESQRLGKALLGRGTRAGGGVPKAAEPSLDAAGSDKASSGDDLLSTLDRKDDGPWVSVIAFRNPVPLGSVVFPWPQGEGKLRWSALKPGAPYPPRPEREKDWITFESSGGPGWNCVPAPPGLLTRAVRLVFEPKDREKPGKFWRLEGLRLLNQRFANVFPKARVRVSSGKLSPTGEWDAQRTEPLGPDKPGVYSMEWQEPQTIAGLAIKEIDGATAEIDVWQGPLPGEAPLDSPAHEAGSGETGWQQVHTYRQQRRVGDYDLSANRYACYMDGYVDFAATAARGPVRTRAVRIRVTEQWLDSGLGHHTLLRVRRHDGRIEHGIHTSKSYCTWLDTRVCQVMGVAVLSPLGDDPPRDPLAYDRLEIWDGKAGKFLKELPLRLGWESLAFGPDGTLYAIGQSHKDISRLDLDAGTLIPVVRDCQPQMFAVGPDGTFYVRSHGDGGRRPILKFDAQGKKVGEIGHAGGFRPGLWDAECFGEVRQLCADREQNLWVVESQDNPRRIVQYKTDGTFVKEIVGNTHYGGYGTVDRTNALRAFHGAVEFELDWRNRKSRIRALLGNGFNTVPTVAIAGGEPVMRRCNGRLYLVTSNNTLGCRQTHGVVYLYQEQEGTVRAVAAMGSAEYFAPLRRSDILALLPRGTPPRGFEFLWYDRNGNGQVDAEEVDFQQKVKETGVIEAAASVGPFDDVLGCCGNGAYYEVEKFLPNGVPVYRRSPQPGSPTFRLNNGNFLTLYGYTKEAPQPAGKPGLTAVPPTVNFVVTPQGEKIWSYPAGFGVSGLWIPGWIPGYVTNQLALVGHETAHAGELGEFFVINDNTGQWRIWTADGMLAGNLLYHQADPRAHLFGRPDVKFGDRLDPLTAKQEHFHGFFTRTAPDNQYYAVAGFTHMSLLEVRGLEKFRRAQGSLQVTAQDIDRVRRWEAERDKRRSGGKFSPLVVRNVEGSAPAIDGEISRDEWPRGTPLPGNPGVTFRAVYDANHLYLCWEGRGAGPLANDAKDFRRLFKTGACLDFQIGTQEGADPKRQVSVAGDQRLLITFGEGKPCVVLYQPVAPGASAEEAWATQTPGGGEVRFDRVVQLKAGVPIAMKGEKDFVVEAAIPLKVLDLKPSVGLRLKGDWGILTSEDGHQVKTRAYWSNLNATGTADEPTEARLEPHRWGTIVFETDATRRSWDSDFLDGKPGANMKNPLDELEER